DPGWGWPGPKDIKTSGPSKPPSIDSWHNFAGSQAWHGAVTPPCWTGPALARGLLRAGRMSAHCQTPARRDTLAGLENLPARAVVEGVGSARHGLECNAAAAGGLVESVTRERHHVFEGAVQPHGDRATSVRAGQLNPGEAVVLAREPAKCGVQPGRAD